MPEQFIVAPLYVVPIVLAARRLPARWVAVVAGLAIGLYVIDAYLEEPPWLGVPLTLAALAAISGVVVSNARAAEKNRAATREAEEARREAAEALARASESEARYARLCAEAQEAVSARDEFLSVAGHELRTPVHVVSMLAEVALREAQSAAASTGLIRRLEELGDAAHRLTRLTRQVLDVAHVNAGKPVLAREEFGLDD